MLAEAAQKLAEDYLEEMCEMRRMEPSAVQVEGLFRWMDLLDDSPEDAFLVVKLMVELVLGDHLYTVAAGPLEDLLRKHGEAVIALVEEHAKTSRRFRIALGGVWSGPSMNPDVWKRVQVLAIAEGTLGLHDYRLPTPEGWQLDDSRGKGLATYEWLGSPPEGKAYVRLHAHAKADPTLASVEAAILACKTYALGAGGFTQQTSEMPLRTSVGPLAPVSTFTGHPDGWLQSTAYVDAPKAVYCIELLARPSAVHVSALPYLEDFTQRFQLVD
jgi:hypothetical protein